MAGGAARGGGWAVSDAATLLLQELEQDLEQWASHQDVVWWLPRRGDVLASDMTVWDRPLCSPHWRLHDVVGHCTMLSEWTIHPGGRNLWVFFAALGADGHALRCVADDEYRWSGGGDRWSHPLHAALAIAARRGYWRGLR